MRGKCFRCKTGWNAGDLMVIVSRSGDSAPIHYECAGPGDYIDGLATFTGEAGYEFVAAMSAGKTPAEAQAAG